MSEAYPVPGGQAGVRFPWRGFWLAKICDSEGPITNARGGGWVGDKASGHRRTKR